MLLRTRTPRKGKKAIPFRPTLERLEDRLAPAVTVTDMGSLPSISGAVVSGMINNSDQVAVVVGQHASYRWQSGTFSLADIYPSTYSYVLSRIDDSSTLTGYYTFFHHIGLRYFGANNYQTLDPGFTNGESEVLGVNKAGDAVGFSNGQTVDPQTGAYSRFFTDMAQLWKAGTRERTDLNLGEGSRATAINDRGQITGYYRGPSGAQGAFLYQGGNAQPLPNPAGFTTSRGIDINDHSWIIGAARNASGEVGILWKPDPKTGQYVAQMLDFIPLDINDANVIVGAGGQLSIGGLPSVNVNSLLPAGSGWTIRTITGINDSNHIVGSGTYAGGGQGNSGLYLLTGLDLPSVDDVFKNPKSLEKPLIVLVLQDLRNFGVAIEASFTPTLTIDGTDFRLPLDGVAKWFGVDHFNWEQKVTEPDVWTVEIDTGAMRFTAPKPFLDPIDSPPNRYVITNEQGLEATVALPFTPDRLPPYFNEGGGGIQDQEFHGEYKGLLTSDLRLFRA